MDGLTGISTTFFATDCIKNEQKACLVLPRSAKVSTKSAPDISMIRYSSNISCYVHALSNPTATHVTHCLPSSKSMEGVEIEVAGINRSVCVKFQLMKECPFGDHIFMVGDDPILGSWNPSDAIPLNWSEGHIWTLLLEMPVEKSIRYKFLVKGSSGEISWQEGPDRVFQPWKTKNVVVVREEWGNAEAQKISEELKIVNENEELMGNKVIAENTRVSGSDTHNHANDCTGTENNSRSVLNLDNGAYLKEKPSSSASKKSRSSDISFQKKVPTKSSPRRVRVDSVSPEAADEGSLVVYDEGPVLVPGLTLPWTYSEEALVEERRNSILADTSLGADILENLQKLPFV